MPRRHLSPIGNNPGAGGGSGGPPTGAAGGDLSGTYPNPTVAKLNTVAAASYALLAGPTFTGAPTLPTGTVATTQTAANNSTAIATTAYVDTADALKANLASPTFTGTPTLPTGTIATTQATSDSSTKIATTAFVAGRAGQVGGPPLIVIRTGDSGTISSDNTPNSDDTLLWAVGASDRWFFKAMLIFTGATGGGSATTEDLLVGWSVPASGTMQWGNLGGTGSTFNGYGSTLTSSSPLAILTESQTFASGSFGGSWGVVYTGFYTGGGTGGNVTLQWSQNTSNAATLLIAKNSMIQAWKLA